MKKKFWKSKQKAGERDWERFSFVCSKDIIQKVHDISEKEGFTIRDIMELFLQRGISEYEKKNGVAKPKRKKSVETLLWGTVSYVLKTRVEEEHIYLDPRISFQEIDRYFLSGCACAFFK